MKVNLVFSRTDTRFVFKLRFLRIGINPFWLEPTQDLYLNTIGISRKSGLNSLEPTQDLYLNSHAPF